MPTGRPAFVAISGVISTGPYSSTPLPNTNLSLRTFMPGS